MATPVTANLTNEDMEEGIGTLLYDSSSDGKSLLESPTSNNPSGKNGKSSAPKPTAELRSIIERYYQEDSQLKGYKEINSRLKRDHPELAFGSASAYYRATRLMQIGTCRKSPLSNNDIAQAITKIKDKDASNAVGYRAMQHKLLMENGMQVSRDKVYAAMSAYDQDGLAARKPGAKRIHRHPIISVGPNEQWSMDGHDKLATFGFGIYGIRDVYSGRWLAMRVLPSNRRKANTLVVYLEAVLQSRGFPIQIATDRGSEIMEISAQQRAFRETLSAINMEDIIPHVMLKSTRNITIERGWVAIRKRFVDAVKIEIQDAASRRIITLGHPVDTVLLGWLAAPFLQGQLDSLIHELNAYPTRYQKEKALPSGASRNTIYHHPERWGGTECLQSVAEHMDTVQGIIEVARGEAQLDFVNDRTLAVLQEISVLESLQLPAKSWEEVWSAVSTLRETACAQLDGFLIMLEE